MDEVMRMLGQRIVDAARLAAAAHLQAELHEEELRQQQAAGGAGIRLSTDGALPLSGDRLVRSLFAERRAG